MLLGEFDLWSCRDAASAYLGKVDRNMVPKVSSSLASFEGAEGSHTEETQAREGIPSLGRALGQELALESGWEPSQEPQHAVETAGKDQNCEGVA